MKKLIIIAMLVIGLFISSCATTSNRCSGSGVGDCSGRWKCKPDKTLGCDICECIPDPWWNDQTYQNTGEPPFKSDNRPQQPGVMP